MSKRKPEIRTEKVSLMKNATLESADKLSLVDTTQKKILVADDDEFMRFAIGQKLREEGFKVSTATDGGEAMEFIKKEKHDLVILDLMMPYVSGPEFLNLMQARYEPENRIPVIIISAIDQQELRDGGYKLEGYHFVPKPFTLEELIHAVNHILSFGKS
jgi:DNA-binding response OmpR family regulator